MMISNDVYQKITRDIVGSRTKNRFMYEMSFGIKSMYDLYLNKKGFFIIFDYACDIEISQDSHINFYQLKTTKKSYSVDQLLNKKNSILQKLVDLKIDPAVHELYIVSNMGLIGADTDANKFSNMEKVCFNNFPIDIKNKIINGINWPNKKPFLENIFFINSDLCLKTLSTSLLGYTTEFLSKLFKGAPCMPVEFQKSILSIVMEKANYEYDTFTLDETIEKKGITLDDLAKIVTQYHANVISFSGLTYEKIKNYSDKLGLNVLEGYNLRCAYNTFYGKGYFDDNINDIIEKLKLCYLNSDYYKLSPLDAINKIVSEYVFDIEFTYAEKVFLAICSYERL